MPIEIRIPRLGWSMEEGTFLRWHKNEGDTIRPGDVLYELEGEKATQDIEAVDAGILRIPPNSPKPGDVVAVGSVVGLLLSEQESAGGFEIAQASVVTATEKVTAARPATDAPSSPRTDSSSIQRTVGRVAGNPISSPRARRVATELGVDWKSLAGTGTGGRVRERDVRAAVAEHAGATVPGSLSLQSIPVSSIRRTIADGLVASLRSAAHVTLSTTADVTEVMQILRQWKEYEKEKNASRQFQLGWTDVLIRATAGALQHHPLLNSRWEGDRIVLLSDINIGIAVETDHGLMVPVLRGVQRMRLADIAAGSRELIQQARAKRLAADAYHGGTFTISNLGMFGIDVFTPIIRHGETAIVGVGAIRREPVVIEGDRIVPRDRMMLNLSFDHRVLDGVPAAKFLDTLRRNLEHPARILADAER